MNLTDRQSASGISETDLIHIVIQGDHTDSPQGSSYKVEIGEYLKIFSGNTDVFVSGGSYSDSTYTFNNSTGGTFSISGLTHNSVHGLQGGLPDEYYHLTLDQLNGLIDLLYKFSVNSIVNLTPISEKGVPTPVTIRYNMISNSDTFTSASIDNGVGNVLSRVNTGNNDVAVGNLLDSKTYTLTMNYVRKGSPATEVKSATYTAVVPKWANVSSLAVIDSYALCSANLGTKILTTSTAISNTGSASNQYMWFISTSATSDIYDANNFKMSKSLLNSTANADGTASDPEFYIKSFTMTLQDGSTVTAYSYRTRTLKTFAGNIYRIT